MSQPPYGAPPPQPGQPQGYPPNPGVGAPPAYLQGGPPAGGPVGGGYGLALPPAPPSQKRTIGFLMGLATTVVLLGFVALVLIISLAD